MITALPYNIGVKIMAKCAPKASGKMAGVVNTKPKSKASAPDSAKMAGIVTKKPTSKKA
jgi:hypothetical protein